MGAGGWLLMTLGWVLIVGLLIWAIALAGPQTRWRSPRGDDPGDP